MADVFCRLNVLRDRGTRIIYIHDQVRVQLLPQDVTIHFKNQDYIRTKTLGKRGCLWHSIQTAFSSAYFRALV